MIILKEMKITCRSRRW